MTTHDPTQGVPAPHVTSREEQPALWQPGLPSTPGAYWLHARLHPRAAFPGITPNPTLTLLHAIPEPGGAVTYRVGERVLTAGDTLDAMHAPAALPLLPGDPRNPQEPETRPGDHHPISRDEITVVYRLHMVDRDRMRRVYQRYCQAFPNWASADLTSDRDILTELISNLELVTQARAADVTTWSDLGVSH